jgi:alpha-mannosidase
VFEADLPARSWQTFTLGWVERAAVSRPRPVAASPRGVSAIANDALCVTAKLGATGIRFTHGKHELLEPPGLSALLVEDEFGPWGGHYEEKTSLELLTVRERWRIVAREILERGPVRAAMWCRLAGARSRLDLTITLGAGDQHVVVDARVFFDEERARLKLALPGGDTADFAVPGGVVRRGPQGEVPGGRWVRVLDRRSRPRFLFATDALYNFNAVNGCFYATVVRASRFTLDQPESTAALGAHEPVIDRGEFRFRFLLGAATPRTTAAAEQFEQPPLIVTVPGQKLQK